MYANIVPGTNVFLPVIQTTPTTNAFRLFRPVRPNDYTNSVVYAVSDDTNVINETADALLDSRRRFDGHWKIGQLRTQFGSVCRFDCLYKYEIPFLVLAFCAQTRSAYVQRFDSTLFPNLTVPSVITLRALNFRQNERTTFAQQRPEWILYENRR